MRAAADSSIADASKARAAGGTLATFAAVPGTGFANGFGSLI